MKEYRLKSAKGIEAWSRVQDISKRETFYGPLPLESWSVLLFLIMMCENTHGVLPTREAHLSLVSRDFIETLLCIHGRLPLWLISLAPPEVKLIP